MRDIEAQFEQLVQLAHSSASKQEFYGEVLRTAVQATLAVGGIIWTTDGRDPPRIESQWAVDGNQLFSPQYQQQHEQAIRSVVQGRKGLLVPAVPLRHASQEPGADRFVSVLHPFLVRDESAGVLEIVQPASPDSRDSDANVEFLAGVAGLLSDFHLRLERDELRNRESIRADLDRFIRSLHSQLELQKAAYTIVNDCRQFLRCDRVSLARWDRDRATILAISGTSELNRRSEVVRKLERALTIIGRSGEELSYPSQANDLPPEAVEHLDGYLDLSHARRLVAIPVVRSTPDPSETASDRSTVAILVAELYGSAEDQSFAERLRLMLPHAEQAVTNSLRYSSVPLLPLLRYVGETAHRLGLDRVSRAGAVLLALISVAAILLLVPAELTVQALGEVQPQVARNIFAPQDGVIQELRVAHNASVATDEVLLVMRSSELELQLRKIEGDIQAAEERLRAIEATRLIGRASAPADEVQRLAGLEQEQRELLAGYEEQRKVLLQEHESLNVRSPMEGRILTWDLEQLLGGRPVKRGQTLMRVAKVEGPWLLELRIPDHRTGHVLDAQKASTDRLPVELMLNSHPGETLSGSVRRIEQATELDEHGEPFVRAIVEFDHRSVADLRPGATATAKIHCGQRSLGYVWLHEFIAAIQSRILF